MFHNASVRLWLAPGKSTISWCGAMNLITPVFRIQANGHTIREGNSWAWGNNELQHYTAQKAENAYVQNGRLFIAAHFQEGLERPYTSARIRSKGKGDWLYGRVEVRAKLPKGKGLWPSVVMLPSERSYGQWPLSGENRHYGTCGL